MYQCKVILVVFFKDIKDMIFNEYHDIKIVFIQSIEWSLFNGVYLMESNRLSLFNEDHLET